MFSLLALSSIPVLRAIGTTVALGVVCNFVLALLVTRRPVAAMRMTMRPLHDRTRALSDPVDRARILQLIPHQGGMCLWDEVAAWDAAVDPPARGQPPRPVTSAAQRRPAARGAPVRIRRAGDGGARRPACVATPAALRDPACWSRCAASQLHVARIDDLPGELECEADVLVEGEGSQQYAFRITHAGTLLAEGRAAVMLARRPDTGARPAARGFGPPAASLEDTTCRHSCNATDRVRGRGSQRLHA